MDKTKRFFSKYNVFGIPVFIFVALIVGLILEFVYNLDFAARVFFIIGIIPGGLQILTESVISIKNKSFALDYIAILAVAVAVLSQEYLVGGVIALMISSGKGLEYYAQKKAKSSLVMLSNRIPREVIVWKSESETENKKIKDVKIKEKILVRKGEVIPLDGQLVSAHAQIDESTLTGEPYFVDRSKGDTLRSGTVNIGNSIIVLVTKVDRDSTYRQIINMVEKAQEEKAPLVRAAHKYNAGFTVIALLIALFAYLYFKDFNYVLAVLVIATPCPLLIAAPVALIGGMSASAKKKIIIKNLSSLEAVSKADTIVFDKTGTITLGKPILKDIYVKDKRYDKNKILQIAEAMERNSLHPFARSIVEKAKKEKIKTLIANSVHEEIGKGIYGLVGKKEFSIIKGPNSEMNHLSLMEGKKSIAEIIFEDTLKKDAKDIISKISRGGVEIHVFTGDKKEAAQKLAKELDGKVKIKYGMSPKEKEEGIRKLKKEGKTIVMVGDGINDAPALALSDVGMVFSHEEHTASSEAADIVFLGGNFSEVLDSIKISKRTMTIAKQSMLVGIGLSVVGMGFAAFGFIIPIVGAVLQEAIDVSVILNSLRTIWFKK